MKKYELVVVGGGFAGAAAAISAARLGVKTLIIEKTNCFGGAAAYSLVNPFMPFWTMVEENGEKKRKDLSAGIFAEICDKLREHGAMKEDSYYFNEEYLKIILNRMVTESGADILFHSFLTGVNKDGEKIKSIEIATKSGILTVEADRFIDATGDADLAYLAGCPYRLGREGDGLCQPMTLCFRLAGVDKEKYWEVKPKINELYRQFKAEGKIQNPREDVLIFNNNLIDGILHFNSTRVVKHNPVDVFDVTKAEIMAREQMVELHQFLKNNIEGFENSEIVASAMQIGARESRMIDGEYILTSEDLKDLTDFEDKIALGNYDIDIHNPEGSGTSHYYFKPGEYYTIPYRTLVPKKADNLLVCGRCISTTHEAQASIRIMPIVCTLGEAAGVAVWAANGSDAKMKDVDIKKVQDKLIETGAAL